MAVRLLELPTELLDSLLRYLPLSDLLSFARTSKSNYNLAVHILTYLDLAIFPRRIHALLAFLDATNADDDDKNGDDGQEDSLISRYWSQCSRSDMSVYQVGLTTPIARASPSRTSTMIPPQVLSSKQRKLNHQKPSSTADPERTPPSPLSLRTAEITAQNSLASSILSTSSLINLRSLTLRLYDLSSPDIVTTIATRFPSLTNLTLDFSHPYIHDTTLPARYWEETPKTGSPIWNILSGVGDVNACLLKLHSLRSLKLARAGITSYQLRHLISTNPDLREIKLSLCRGVDLEFVSWLGSYVSSGRSRLEVVQLNDCAMLDLKVPADFDFVTSLASSSSFMVKELSLRGCSSVSEETFLHLAIGSDEESREWAYSKSDLGAWSGIRKLVSPKGVVVRSHHDFVSRVSRVRNGSVSPALTVSDGMVGGSASSLGYFGKIEVDPALVL